MFSLFFSIFGKYRVGILAQYFSILFSILGNFFKALFCGPVFSLILAQLLLKLETVLRAAALRLLTQRGQASYSEASDRREPASEGSSFAKRRVLRRRTVLRSKTTTKTSEACFASFAASFSSPASKKR